jgi:hypothetical protein
MRFNKRKFLKNLFFFILFISLVVLGVYLWKTPEARNNIYEYYSEVLASFSDEEIIDVEEVFSISYDPAIQTSIIPGKDGMLVINKNRIAEYTTSKNPVWVKDINISNPIIATASNRFVIAESGGKKIMTFAGRNLVWEMDMPNEIRKVTINKDGHVGVIFSQPGYKSGFLYFSPEGKEIFKKLFANTNLIDADISPKGDMVAMIEADVSSAIISSAISFMSNKGQIVYSEIEEDILLSGIRFVDKDNVIAVGDNRLIKIDKEYNKTIFDDFSGKTVSGINLENEGKVIEIYRTSDGIFANKSVIDIVNANNKKTGTGEVAGVVKTVESSGKTIAVVLADRVDFFDISGKYLNTLNISGKYKSLKLYNSGGYACIDLSDVLRFVKIR